MPPEPRPLESASTLRNGITWKRFVLQLPVEAARDGAREFVPILDDPASVFAENAFEFLARSGRVPQEAVRELGRALTKSGTPDTAHAFLPAFSALGLGHLDLAAGEPGRYRFTSKDLRLASAQSRTPCCSLVLGFCEGIVERLTGKPALGSEVSCRSMGHEACVFQVSARN